MNPLSKPISQYVHLDMMNADVWIDRNSKLIKIIRSNIIMAADNHHDLENKIIKD